jgi:hypothetical protein
MRLATDCGHLLVLKLSLLHAQMCRLSFEPQVIVAIGLFLCLLLCCTMVLADVLILFIGIILARFFYKYIFSTFSIWKFTFLAVCIQIIHDILFYFFFSIIPKGHNSMIDFFKEYAKEVGVGAIAGDSFMMILACLLSSYFATANLNTNIISLVISVYFFPYMINHE